MPPEWNGQYYIAPVSVPDREPDEAQGYDERDCGVCMFCGDAETGDCRSMAHRLCQCPTAPMDCCADEYDGNGDPRSDYDPRDSLTPADHELDKQKALREDGVHHDGTPRERVKKGE